MAKSRKRPVPYVKEHAPIACAMTAGPALLEALRPVAERVLAHPAYQHRVARRDMMDNVPVMLTMAEAEAIVAAAERAAWRGG